MSKQAAPAGLRVNYTTQQKVYNPAGGLHVGSQAV